jgi:hypothetical protein
MSMTCLRRLGLGSLLSAVLIGSIFTGRVAADFNRNLLIDDTVFSDNSTMNAAQVDTFLNGFPYSCISPNSGFQAKKPTGYSPSGGFTYGSFVSAGQVIYQAAQVYGINPRVLLVTLQKEQSLVVGASGYCNDGNEHKYAAAVGYGCPDGGTVYNWSGVSLYRRNGVERTVTGSTCVNAAAKAGFSQQVIRAAWLLKFGQQRSLGNTNWAVISGSWDNSDDPPTCYGGPMTQGTLKRCQNSSATYFDGYTTIDGGATHMDSGATAALYWYTPHIHGNQNFVSLFETWFGSTISASYYSCGPTGHNLTDLPPGRRVIPNRPGAGATDNLSVASLNLTSTGCIEVHTWLNPDYQHWIQHTATNYPSVDPASNKIVAADTNGDGRDELYLISYPGTGSGRIEVHGWAPSNQQWISHIATNHASVSSANDEVITADTNGDGRDEFFLVEYRNTASGRIEVHGWSPNLQQWVGHIATNHAAMDPATAEVMATDSGDGREKLILVIYTGTASGRIEVHGWSPNLQQWVSHIATTP